MRSIHVLSSIAVLTAGACGDPLMTAQERGDPLFSVRGTVTKGLLAESPAVAQEVGVLWLNLLDDNSTVLVEATPADVIAETLPAAFDVSVLRAPSDRMLGTTLISYSEGGASEQPVDRNRVAFGVVVVAPEGTFASLPDSAALTDFVMASDGTPGPLLQSFTYVSPFTVRYVRGAAAENVTIRDINGVASTLADFTVFDVGAWARGTENAVCRDRALGEGWSTPEVQACIERETAANPGESSGNIGNQCLYAWRSTRDAEFDAACGPQPGYPESDFRNSVRLLPGESVTLPLGDGDIRRALSVGGFIFLG